MQVSMRLHRQSSGDTCECHVCTTCVTHVLHEHLLYKLHRNTLSLSIQGALKVGTPLGQCNYRPQTKGQVRGSQWWPLYRGYTVGYIASCVNITLEPTIFLHSGSQWACSTATASSVLRGNHLFSLEISNHVARRMRSAGPVQSNSKT